MELTAGIEIGGTKLQLVLGDETGAICERRKLEVDPAKGGAGIRDQLAWSLPNFVQGRKVAAVGVGFGGPVDWRTGRICRSHQIEGWSEFDLAGWLQPTGRRPRCLSITMPTWRLWARPVAGQAWVQSGLLCDAGQRCWRRPGHRWEAFTMARLRAKPKLAMFDWIARGHILESRCSGWAVNAGFAN